MNTSTAQLQDEDQSKRVIEDVEAGEGDDLVGTSKKAWWARLWKDPTGPRTDEKMRQKKIQKEMEDATRRIEEILKIPETIQVDDFPPGYPLQAAFQSSASEFSIYRNFDYLHSRVILELQDQLRELEDRLQMLDKLHWESPAQRDRVSSRIKDLEAAQPTSPTIDAVDNAGEEESGSHHVAQSTINTSHSMHQDRASSSNEVLTTLPAMLTLNGAFYKRVDEQPASEQQIRSNSSKKDSETDLPDILARCGVVNTMGDDTTKSDQLMRSAPDFESPVQHSRSDSSGADNEATPSTLLVPGVRDIQAKKAPKSNPIKQLREKPILSERAKLLDDIQEKLVRYDEILVHARRLAEFQRPTHDEWLNLRKWYYNKANLSSEDEDKYIRMKYDLITLRPRVESGKIDDWIKRLVILRISVAKYLYKPNGRGFQDGNIRYFKEPPIERLAVLLVSIVIILLLAVPVFVMFCVTWIGTRPSTFLNIGLLIVFGFLFSVAMGVLTTAKRAELFAATAAYCAVLVVFIGNFSTNAG